MKYVCNLLTSHGLCYWRTVRSFLTHKGILWKNEIFLIHNGMTVDGEREVSETWNQACINIAEYISRGKLVENLSMFSNTGKNISAWSKHFHTCFCLFFLCHTSLYFWKGHWALGYIYSLFWDFPHISYLAHIALNCSARHASTHL